jgi:hypothetical protein
MAWPESLTAAQQLQIENYVDKVFRPAVLSLAQAMAAASLEVLPEYLSSPTGLTSSLASPAADSVAGLLAGISGSDVIPTNTGLAMAGPLLVSKVTTYTTSLNTLLGTYFTAAVQQDFAQMVGSPNIP